MPPTTFSRLMTGDPHFLQRLERDRNLTYKTHDKCMARLDALEAGRAKPKEEADYDKPKRSRRKSGPVPEADRESADGPGN
jgi:hypothetical protein